MPALTLRHPQPRDEAGWQELWSGYNAFYQRSVEARTTARTWSGLLAGNGQPYGRVAELDGRLVGFVHFFLVPSTSDWAPRCYMQDLFADPEARGQGIGRALIEEVYAEADRQGASQIYWLTDENNVTARALYDRVARVTPFVKYRR